MTDPDRDLMREVGEMLHHVLDERSFECPLTLALVDANGAGLLVRYVAGDQTLESRVLSQLSRSGTLSDMLRFPINFMMTDSKGNAAYRRYCPQGETTTIEH